MPRHGVEQKPPWSAVPTAVRSRVADALGSPVIRGTRVWGGYAPTPTFRLLLANGQRAFLKATNATSNEFMVAALSREVQIYTEVREVLSTWAPGLRGTFQWEDWSIVLLDDAGPKSVPPWTPIRTRCIAQGLATFHASTQGQPVPHWLSRSQGVGNIPEEHTRDPNWIRSVAALAGKRADEAIGWLQEYVPILRESIADLDTAEPPAVFLHGDVRSDNLRLVNGRLVLFDWPHASYGPPEDDLAGFAQTVSVECGPSPEEVVAWYEEIMPVRPQILTAAVAMYAVFFANAAWRPPIPGLPRLRPFQQAQTRVTLAWAARRLELPEPKWLDAF